MRRQDIYKLLEEKMLSYSDYAKVSCVASGDPLLPIRQGKYLTARQIDRDMLRFTGGMVYVRSGVLYRLKRAAKLLAAFDNGLRLEVVYGYRSLEIQTTLFEKYKAELARDYEGEELLAAVHRLVAVPEVAGHPAGAAVDIQILRGEKPLNFGTVVHEFVPDTFTFSPFTDREAWQNRQLLRRGYDDCGLCPI